MRLDLFLKKTHLVRQRAQAKAWCDAGRVQVNGRPAKPSMALAGGDRLLLQLPSRILEAEVLDVPERANLARRDIGQFVRILRDERLDRIEASLGADDPDDTDDPDAAAAGHPEPAD